MDIWTSEHDEWMSVDYYFDMIGRKTASLIAGSAEAGAVLATEDETVIAAYRRFGWALGLAFQLNDDLLGIWGDEAITGKETSDIATRKKSLPLIYALANATGADGERLRVLLAQSEIQTTDEEVREVLGILERVGAQEYTRSRALEYRDEALAEIGSIRTGRPSLDRAPRRCRASGHQRVVSQRGAAGRQRRRRRVDCLGCSSDAGVRGSAISGYASSRRGVDRDPVNWSAHRARHHQPESPARRLADSELDVTLPSRCDGATTGA